MGIRDSCQSYDQNEVAFFGDYQEDFLKRCFVIFFLIGYASSDYEMLYEVNVNCWKEAKFDVFWAKCENYLYLLMEFVEIMKPHVFFKTINE